MIENRHALPRCMCIMHNLDANCFVGSMIQMKRNVKKNGFVLLQQKHYTKINEDRNDPDTN